MACDKILASALRVQQDCCNATGNKYLFKSHERAWFFELCHLDFGNVLNSAGHCLRTETQCTYDFFGTGDWLIGNASNDKLQCSGLTIKRIRMALNSRTLVNGTCALLRFCYTEWYLCTCDVKRNIYALFAVLAATAAAQNRDDTLGSYLDVIAWLSTEMTQRRQFSRLLNLLRKLRSENCKK